MTRKPRSHVRILKYRTRAIHAKSKTRFQLANKKISSGNVYMIQNCFKFLDCNSCLTFKLSILKMKQQQYDINLRRTRKKNPGSNPIWDSDFFFRVLLKLIS